VLMDVPDMDTVKAAMESPAGQEALVILVER
jgi:hypothetical protein